ncbi:SUMF1/EgtB/PvdO family nonheme iron enzyme [Streptomyces sp. CC210A]|uniref:formylglycine-generating enzyme family protein n=1 Tax=Streptomyces sp. CC210A TaxID=2898184 RepID=UPI0027E53B54|nr:SUMF1/EgtB/PvdO family nonheme iron enzyme [Streptomyces sp. CC210A]
MSGGEAAGGAGTTSGTRDAARGAAAGTNPNLVTDRAAMGLPDSFVRRQSDPVVRHRDLLAEEPETLAVIVSSPHEGQCRRHAAGTVLSLVGDPRIRVLDPEMLDVPAARVTLGLPPERVAEVTDRWSHVGVVEEWIAKESPPYEADIAAFRIARYPVTNDEYRAFLEDTHETWLPRSWPFGVFPWALSNHPVWGVPPEAADAYAAWLSRRTGRRFRLPTEAEWEYAASGGDGREFPWGETFRPECANTVEGGPLTTTPVGVYAPGRSPFGLDDVAGNVEEFVADEYRPYPGGAPAADDLLKAHGTYRVARGGSFTRYGDLTRCRRRHGWYDKAIYAIGFRLAETP